MTNKYQGSGSLQRLQMKQFSSYKGNCLSPSSGFHSMIFLCTTGNSLTYIYLSSPDNFQQHEITW